MISSIVLQVTTTVTTYSPPSPLSFQYWFFPVLFMLMIASPFFATTMLFHGSTEDLIIMTLLGIITGTFIDYLAQMVPFELLLLEVAILFVYIWRAT